MPEKKQSVHLEDQLHKNLKVKAAKEDSTIEKLVHEILKKEIKNKNDEQNEKEK